MPAIKRDLVIEVGAAWNSPIVLRVPGGAVYDLSGATARMQIRDVVGNLVFDLTTENGGLSIDVATGRIDRRIGALATARVKTDVAFYDMEIYPGANQDMAWKLYRGRVKFIDELTHA